jgi:hypothetical protein
MPPRKTPVVPLPRVKTDTLADGRISLTGQTFEIKDRIKAAGGRWHAEDKVWHLPAGTDLAFLREPLPPPEPVAPWFACCADVQVVNFSAQEFICKRHAVRPWWLCCDAARIVRVQDKSCSCSVHSGPTSNFRVRGSLYTGD